MEQSVITLELEAGKSFMISFTSLILAHFSIFLIAHTDKGSQPVLLVASLWLLFVLCLGVSIWSLFREFNLIRMAKWATNNSPTDEFTSYGVSVQLMKAMYFLFAANTFVSSMPTNIVNLPSIEDNWIDKVALIKTGFLIAFLIFGITNLMRTTVRPATNKKIISATGKKLHKFYLLTMLIFEEVCVFLVCIIMFIIFGIYHSYQWFLNTNAIAASIAIVIALLFGQALIFSMRLKVSQPQPAI